MTTRRINILVAGTIALLPTSVFAQMATSDPFRIVSDPLYLPLAGQFLGTTSYQYSSTTEDVLDSTGTKTESVHVDNNLIDQDVLYGITDDLTAHFNWAYDPSRDAKRDIVGGGTVDRSSSGWTNPDFGLTYRVLDERQSPLVLDLRLDYSPDAFPSKAATPTDEGTIARGGQMLDLGATLGHSTQQFTIAGLFDAQWLDTRKTLNQTSGDFSRTSSVWNYSLGLATQTRFSDVLSLNAGVSELFANDTSVINDTSGLTHLSHVGDTTNLNVALNYHFIPNRLVGSVGYEHNFFGPTHNLFATTPTNDTTIRNHDEDVVGVSLRYTLP
jgi:hypothetical protein